MRFKKWLSACNNENVVSKPAMLVYKQYRICRRHFDTSCMNGGCRRLLKTAIPKLYLNQEANSGDATTDDDAIDLKMETDPLMEYVINEMDDSAEYRDPDLFNSIDINYDSQSTAGKSNQRRDIRK